MGTPQFAVPILDALIKNYQVVGVITQPDKKVGRKQILSISPIKELAVQNKIKVWQPTQLKKNKEFITILKDLKPDVIVVTAYGYILPKEILNIPKYGVLNVHSSLLPKYRGPSPIQAAILNGDKVSGVTIMLVNQKMDEGAILAQKQADLDTDETFNTLHDKLSILGTHLLIDTLPKYLNNEIKPQPQDSKQVSYCKLITKEDGKIDWQKSALEIERMVRAFDPWPGTWTIWNKKKLKISEVQLVSDQNDYQAGQVYLSQKDLAIKTGQGSLVITQLQLEGKKVMSSQDFLNGYPEIVDSVLS